MCLRVRYSAPSGTRPLLVGGSEQNGPVLLADVVSASQAVAATRSRKAKVAALAEALAKAEPDEVETVTSYLAGSLRQRRTGLGWRGLSELPEPADSPTLTVLEVHEAFDAIAAHAGAGSQAARAAAVAELFGRATADEQAWLRGAVTGAVRQGALDALVQEAVAAAASVPLAVRTPRRDARRLDHRRRGRRARPAARRRWPGSGSRSAGRCCRCSRPARPTSRPRWPRPAAASSRST